MSQNQESADYADPIPTSMRGLLNEPLRARVEALNSEQQRAIEKAAHEHDKAFAALREGLVDRIEAINARLADRIEAVTELLDTRIRAQAELVDQYHAEQKYALEVASKERENSAIALRDQYAKAQGQADAEREKSARALQHQLEEQIKTGDANLRLHIDHQTQQVNAAFAASEKAILKAEVATNKRFDAVNEFRAQLGDQARTLLPREIFEQFEHQYRTRHDAIVDLSQELNVRLTELEARGAGGKDQAADLKATLAIGVAIVSVIASVVISLITLVGH